MKAVALIAVSACLLMGCTRDYYEIKKADLSQPFIVNSSPTFQGYFYQGTDADFHYFTSKWKYGSDKRFKINKADMAVSREAAFGKEELLVFLFEPNNLEYETFTKMGNKTIYIQKK